MRDRTNFPLARVILRIVLIASCVVLVAPELDAQATPASTQIYGGEEVDSPPRFANAAKTARFVADSYPRNLRAMGIGGTVQVQFIVDSRGNVEPESIEIVQASTPAFGIAAKEVAKKITFLPGATKGQSVRTRVLLPIVYK